MSSLAGRLRRLEERAGTDGPVLVLIEVAPGEKRGGDEIMAAMGWDVHPNLRDLPRIYLLLGHRRPGAPPRLFNPDGPDDGRSRVPGSGPPTRRRPAAAPPARPPVFRYRGPP